MTILPESTINSFLMAEYEGRLPFEQELERLKADLVALKGCGEYLHRQAAEKMRDAVLARERYAEKLATDLEWVLRERRLRICHQTEEHLRGGMVDGAGIYASKGQIGIFETGVREIVDYAHDQRRIKSIDGTGNIVTSMITVDSSLVKREPHKRARFYCPQHLALNLMRAGAENRYATPFTEREGKFVVTSPDSSEFVFPEDFKVEVPSYPTEVYKQLGLM